MLGPLGATISVLGKPLTLAGRATRSELWWFFVVNLVITMTLCVSDAWRAVQKYGWDLGPQDIAPVEQLAVWWTLLTVLPWTALHVRRLHDVGLSGLYGFIVWVPIVGPLVTLVLFLLPSEDKRNAYGPNPHACGGTPLIFTGSKDNAPDGKGYVSWAEREERASREATRKEEVRALYETRVLGLQN